MLDCGHLAFCENCCNTIIRNKVESKRKCPICNKKVKTSIQAFLDSMRTDAKIKDERKEGNKTIILDDSLNVSNNNN